MSANWSKGKVDREVGNLRKTINKDTSGMRGKDRIHQRLSRAGAPFAERSCLLVNGSPLWTPAMDNACEDEVNDYSLFFCYSI